jgi:O-antigen/teichoic acid export membrane protein
MEIRLRQRNFFDTAQLNDTLKGSSIRGGMYTGVSEAGGVILRVASIAILARILIPEHFGLISMVTALTVIGERFKDLGFSFATVQAESITHEQVTNLFWINLGFGAVLTLITALSAKLIAWFYSDNRLIWITLAISMTFLF